MKRLGQLIIAVVVALTIVTPAFPVSDPEITGVALGQEYCFEFVCGSAIFAGDVQLQVAGNPRRGKFFVSVVYDSPLPTTEGGITPITDGDWVISTEMGSFKGIITAGTIIKTTGNNFTVEAELALDGFIGSGVIYFSGDLSHDQFPFTLSGLITQSPL